MLNLKMMTCLWLGINITVLCTYGILFQMSFYKYFAALLLFILFDTL
jgi:hypothetical protein